MGKSQKVPLGNFKWVKEISHVNKNFMKNYNEDSDEEHFLQDDVQYPENLTFTMIAKIVATLQH